MSLPTPSYKRRGDILWKMRNALYPDCQYGYELSSDCILLDKRDCQMSNFANATAIDHDDACLFRLSQLLCQSFAAESNSPYTWRFDFAFPHAATLVGPSPYSGPTELSRVYASGRHLLPPTFEREFNRNHYASIEYTVQAVVHLADAMEPITIQLPSLEFLPLPKQPDSSSFAEYVGSTERLSSSQLETSAKSSRLSLRHKLSSAGPSATLVMKASLNPYVTRSKPLPIHTCVEIGSDAGPCTMPESITLRITSIKLIQVTCFRARVSSVQSAESEYQEVGDDEVLLQAHPERCIVQPRMKTPGTSNPVFFAATFEARTPESTRPSFRTFNINHNHQMKVTIEAQVGSKKYEHKFVVQELNILS